MDKFKALLGSRKFWAAIAGVGVIVAKAYFGPNFPLSEEDLTKLAAIIGTYILGTAYEDGHKGAVPSSTDNPPATPDQPGPGPFISDGVG